MSRPDLNPWHDSVLMAGDLIEAARATITDQVFLDQALRILDALLGGATEAAAAEVAAGEILLGRDR